MLPADQFTCAVPSADAIKSAVLYCSANQPGNTVTDWINAAGTVLLVILAAMAGLYAKRTLDRMNADAVDQWTMVETQAERQDERLERQFRHNVDLQKGQHQSEAFTALLVAIEEAQLSANEGGDDTWSRIKIVRARWLAWAVGIRTTHTDMFNASQNAIAAHTECLDNLGHLRRKRTFPAMQLQVTESVDYFEKCHIQLISLLFDWNTTNGTDTTIPAKLNELVSPLQSAKVNLNLLAR